MTDICLLAVVEVPQSDRVVCQAPNCKHSVYKRIHVVQRNGVLTVLGSECFKKLFGEEHAKPSYGSGEGRLLTPEERQLLVENTARLITQFEAEHQAALEEARLAVERRAALENVQRAAKQRKHLESERQSSFMIPAVQPAAWQPAPLRSSRRTPTPSDPRFQAALLEVKQEYRSRGLDLDLPGWRAAVQHEAKARLR